MMPANDELAHINGITPAVVLADGEHRDVISQSSSAVYKIKRTMDHYYWYTDNFHSFIAPTDIPPNIFFYSVWPPLSCHRASTTLQTVLFLFPSNTTNTARVRYFLPLTQCPVKLTDSRRLIPLVYLSAYPNKAWRNQGGAPINARTCKHLKTLLGEKYELARVKMKNPDGPQPKAKTKPKAKDKVKATGAGASGAKPKTRATKAAASAPTTTGRRTMGKRKKLDEDVDEKDNEEAEDGDEDGDEEHGSRPAKRARKNPRSPIRGRPPGKGKARAAAPVSADEEGEIEAGGDGEGEEAAENAEEQSGSGGKPVPGLLLANKWDIETGSDPTGWWISEKLDGVRTYYDGTQFLSRLGNAFTPPNWFLDKLPKDVTLDGELYGGRGEFQSTVSIVKTVNSVHWKNISFQIFDIPSLGALPFEARYAELQARFGPGGTHAEEQIVVVEHEVARDRAHVLARLREIESLGGEGVMLRRAGSVYEGRRSGSLLKIKTFYDAEAVVTGHAPGKGRNKGSTGALMCKMESGKLFNVGSGLTDKIRKAPPPIGSIITYRFQELTRDGVPRFPSFIGVAVDKDEPKDAEIPDHRKAGAASASAGDA